MQWQLKSSHFMLLPDPVGLTLHFPLYSLAHHYPIMRFCLTMSGHLTPPSFSITPLLILDPIRAQS